MLVQTVDLAINDKIKFKTINTYDPNFKSGIIIGFATYAMAALYGDQIKYHAEVLKDSPELPTDATIFSYVIVKQTNGEVIAVAYDWFDTTTLSIIDTTSSVSVKVFNVPTQEAASILQLLRDNGYIVKQL